MPEIESPQQTPMLDRSDGVTGAERNLARLARTSFLSLWSYANLYRDDSLTKKNGNKKEVCDLLVVFDNHLIIFSDKDCVFQDRGDLDVEWSRWYRGAVLENARQIWGAEKRLRSNPDNVFLDKDCTQRFPIALPASDSVKVHRVAVAHGAADRCKRELGGSGSLMITPDIVGDQHDRKRVDGGVPFAIGQIDPTKGYVHVLDDNTLNIVLTTLDTISDFVAYLEAKERFISNGKLAFAAGEEDLLALYLKNLNPNGVHDFILPANADYLYIEQGLWEHFCASSQRKTQIVANEISYSWDRLIEKFLHHIYAGTSRYNSPHTLAQKERGYRIMAREPRTRRRVLARHIHELIFNFPPTYRATRTILPSRPGDPCYVFLVHLGINAHRVALDRVPVSQ